MPAKIDPSTRQAIARLAVDNERMSAKAIQNSVRAKHERGEIPSLPSERTILSIATEARSKGPSEKARLRTYHWPESHESQLIPWEAAETLFQLVRAKGEITNQEALWFWRITLARPQASDGLPSLDVRYEAAMLMANWYEVTKDEGPARAVEAYLTEEGQAVGEYLDAAGEGNPRHWLERLQKVRARQGGEAAPNRN